VFFAAGFAIAVIVLGQIYPPVVVTPCQQLKEGRHGNGVHRHQIEEPQCEVLVGHPIQGGAEVKFEGAGHYHADGKDDPKRHLIREGGFTWKYVYADLKGQKSIRKDMKWTRVWLKGAQE